MQKRAERFGIVSKVEEEKKKLEELAAKKQARAERFNLTKEEKEKEREEKREDKKRKLLEEIKEKDPEMAEKMIARQKRFATGN